MPKYWSDGDVQVLYGKPFKSCGVKSKTSLPSAKIFFSPKKARLGPQTLTFVSRSGPPFTKRRTEPEFGKHARLTFDQLDKIRPLGPVAPDLVQYWLALGGSGGVRVQCA